MLSPPCLACPHNGQFLLLLCSAELALAGQRVVEAELREARQSERVALKQAKRMSAVVEAHRAAAARRAAAGQGATSAADGGQQQQELQVGSGAVRARLRRTGALLPVHMHCTCTSGGTGASALWCTGWLAPT